MVVIIVMTTLDIAIGLGLDPKKVSPGEHASPCPFCGGNDRFRIWPEKGKDGAYWCRQCQKGGDAVQLLIDAKGLTFKEACEYLGRELPAKRRSKTPTPPRKAPVEFTPRQTFSPTELWQREASAFAEASHATLLKTPDQLEWLAARGITVETARRFKLGWNPKKIYAGRVEWGVKPEVEKDDDGKEKVLDLLVLHRGLVIPHIVTLPSAGEGRGEGVPVIAVSQSPERREGGARQSQPLTPSPLVGEGRGEGERPLAHVESLRIRRPEEGIEDRYRHVKGSSTRPMMIHRSDEAEKGGGVWVVVESRLDGILIAQDAGDLVSVMVLDSASTKPDGEAYDYLRKAPHIMNAVDFDTAGGKASPWWKEHFPQQERWPVPRGKDPGDYRKAGGDIRAWIIAGLPYGLRPVARPCHSECNEESQDTKEAVTETITAKTETETVKSETIQGKSSPSPSSPPIKGGEFLGTEVESSGKAPSPSIGEGLIPSPSMGEGWGEGEKPLRTFRQKCPDCGTVEEVNVYSEPKGYVRPQKCAKCFLKPPTATPRKRAWQ